MKRKNLITLVLLFVMTLSILHEYTFAMFDDEHSTIKEYVSEISGPVQKGDICDIHYEYHLSYILPCKQTYPQTSILDLKPTMKQESYKFALNLDFIKPPIS